jgi:hypothetical protein
MNIIGYFLILGWSPTIDELFISFMKVMKVMLNGKQILKQQNKTKNKRRTNMTLLDHTLSCFFLNNKKVKTYPHKYEEGEKKKNVVDKVG